MHKAFISYHHDNDQHFKTELVLIGSAYSVFIDKSVDTGAISDSLSPQQIRTKIRDEYLKDSSVTIVLVGEETQNRKHVDWEIYSSMFDGTVNKQSGILVIDLHSKHGISTFGNKEKSLVYPDEQSWVPIKSWNQVKDMNPCLPDRIIDNILAKNVTISVVPWYRIASNPDGLSKLIDWTFENRQNCEYDFHRPMRGRNS